MGHSQAEKARNRERILAEASRQVRREGLESVSVGALMKSVGLTHGGFYGHFESRSALLDEALERALREGEANARAQASSAPDLFAGLVRSYLSRVHRDAREQGCAIAALATDVARAEEGPRAVMSAEVESFIGSAAAALGGDEDGAMVAVSAMIGALILSRVVSDPARSDAILRSMREHLRSLEPRGAPEGPEPSAAGEPC